MPEGFDSHLCPISIDFSALLATKKGAQTLDFYNEKINKRRNFLSAISLTMIFRIFYEVSKPSDFHKGGKTLMKRIDLTNINQIGFPSSN